MNGSAVKVCQSRQPLRRITAQPPGSTPEPGYFVACLDPVRQPINAGKAGLEPP
jgi:hypothetical protein